MPDIHLDDERDTLKMVRETLCAVQNGAAGVDRMKHSERVGCIIAEIDRQRPLGSNGKHGDRHTPTCGCADVEAGSHIYHLGNFG